MGAQGQSQEGQGGVPPQLPKSTPHSLFQIPRRETAAAAAKSLQSCPTLCDPIDGSPLGSTVPGIPQARTLEWLPFPSPMHESEK